VLPGVHARSSRSTRLFALLFLLAVVAGLGYLAHATYLAVTDSFVTPMSLSVDNDLVLENKLKITQLGMERARAESELDGVEASLPGLEKGLAELTEMKNLAVDSLAWVRQLNSRQAQAGGIAVSSVSRQRAVIERMVADQRAVVNRSKANLEAGIVSSAEHQREEQKLHELSVSLLENTRAGAAADLSLQEARLGQSSLKGTGGAPMMPDVLSHADQKVRIELELLKLEAEKQTKLSTQRALTAKVAQLEALELELKGRPLYRAIQKSLDVAFIPYTQIDGVFEGAAVHKCVFGYFACRAVGRIAEVVPGEVTLQDPWGSSARGQYAVLELTDREAARAKVLRVRGGGRPPVAPAPSKDGDAAPVE
ncbi:MAG TPA: hypothetical protein VEY30_00360, partial [Myxococcaceae bacterium]|nr:hypothetical protein [Myxococcaceae bacterium]